MPLIPFDQLPDDARVWVFGAAEPLGPDGEAVLLASVDAWLGQWQAHGVPLTCAREWRDGRFLVVGVDQHAAGASGCSVDALFRVLQAVQGSLGTTLLGAGRVFHRNGEGQVVSTARADFGRAPGVSDDTTVFDTAVTRAEDYRMSFERPLRDSWHRALLTADR